MAGQDAWGGKGGRNVLGGLAAGQEAWGGKGGRDLLGGLRTEDVHPLSSSDIMLGAGC